MVKKKVCMLGSFSVGKTSLVRQFVQSMFSEKYKTTIGVKIDKKIVVVKAMEVNLVLWDLPGEDDFQSIQTSYLRGTSGYLLVCDGTRRQTLDVALNVRRSTEEVIGAVPFVLVFNKADLTDEWDIDEETEQKLADDGIHIMRTSAKTGEGV